MSFKEMWKFSGSFDKKFYLRIVSIAFCIWMALGCLQELIQAGELLLSFIVYHYFSFNEFKMVLQKLLEIALIIGISYLNVRFYPFVAEWAKTRYLHKPKVRESIANIRAAYRNGYDSAPDAVQHTTYTTTVNNGYFGTTIDTTGNTSVESNIGGKRMSGFQSAQDQAAGSGVSYLLTTTWGLIVFVLGWTVSFVLGWFVINSIVEE